MKPENVCWTVTDRCKGKKVAAVKQRKRNCRTAGEKMKWENMCLTVTDGCEGEKVAAVKVEAPSQNRKRLVLNLNDTQ